MCTDVVAFNAKSCANVQSKFGAAAFMLYPPASELYVTRYKLHFIVIL